MPVINNSVLQNIEFRLFVHIIEKYNIHYILYCIVRISYTAVFHYLQYNYLLCSYDKLKFDKYDNSL